MYKVNLWVNAKDPKHLEVKYKKSAYEGIVIPKPDKDRMSKVQIQQEVEEKVFKAICIQNPGLEMIYKITSIERIGMDFCLKEGEKV